MTKSSLYMWEWRKALSPGVVLCWTPTASTAVHKVKWKIRSLVKKATKDTKVKGSRSKSKKKAKKRYAQ